VAGGAEDGVELDEDVIVVGVLIVAGKTHGSGEGFGGCGEVAAFAEGEIGPDFLEARGILDGDGEAGHFAFKITALVDGGFLSGLIDHEQEGGFLREFAGGAVGVEGFGLGVDVMEFAGALRVVVGIGHADVGADEGPVLEIGGAEECAGGIELRERHGRRVWRGRGVGFDEGQSGQESGDGEKKESTHRSTSRRGDCAMKCGGKQGGERQKIEIRN